MQLFRWTWVIRPGTSPWIWYGLKFSSKNKSQPIVSRSILDEFIMFHQSLFEIDILIIKDTARLISFTQTPW